MSFIMICHVPNTIGSSAFFFSEVDYQAKWERYNLTEYAVKDTKDLRPPIQH